MVQRPTILHLLFVTFMRKKKSQHELLEKKQIQEPDGEKEKMAKKKELG